MRTLTLMAFAVAMVSLHLVRGLPSQRPALRNRWR